MNDWLRQILLVEIPPKGPTPRLVDVDAARGIAIFLVVLGHVVSRDMPRDNAWYAVLKDAIYLFHMPLFMTLTGISFALSLPTFERMGAVARYSVRRVERLLAPYLLFGLIVLVGKLVASKIMYVDNLPSGTWHDVLQLVVMPASSAAGFLWFIYVYGLYLLTIPPLFLVFGRYPMLLLLLGIAAQFVRWPSWFMIDLFMAYLPFFAGGMLLWIWRPRWEELPLWFCLVALALFVGLMCFALSWRLPKWLMGALSVPAVLALAQWIPERWRQALAWLGRMSMTIYLMNTIAIGLTKAVLLKVMPWDGVNFLLFFPCMLAAGVFAPLAVKMLIEPRLPRLAKYL